MIELMLNPPANASNLYTLPLLVWGSPLYDPQAPGWFRARYKEHLPKDNNQSPKIDVLQVGLVKINPDNQKQTPYIIANHMIAAGVTGRRTADASKMPNIPVRSTGSGRRKLPGSMWESGQQGIDPAKAKELPVSAGVACPTQAVRQIGQMPPTA
jgi:hypothetical protein